MIYASDLEDVFDELEEHFDKIAFGNKSAYTHDWMRKRKMIHIGDWMASDSYGGVFISPFKGMYALVEWDTNYGFQYVFCYSDKNTFIKRVLEYY